MARRPCSCQERVFPREGERFSVAINRPIKDAARGSSAQSAEGAGCVSIYAAAASGAHRAPSLRGDLGDTLSPALSWAAPAPVWAAATFRRSIHAREGISPKNSERRGSARCDFLVAPLGDSSPRAVSSRGEARQALPGARFDSGRQRTACVGATAEAARGFCPFGGSSPFAPVTESSWQ